MRGPQLIPGQTLRLWLLCSLISLRRVQVFSEVLGDRSSDNVLGNAVKELANMWILARLELVFCTDRTEGTLIKHGDAVRDKKCARQFVGNNNDGHVEGVLEQQNQFIEFGGNNWVKPRRWFIEDEDFGTERDRARDCRTLLHSSGKLLRKQLATVRKTDCGQLHPNHEFNDGRRKARMFTQR